MLGGIPHDSTDLRLGGELGVIKIAGRLSNASSDAGLQAQSCRAVTCSAGSLLNRQHCRLWGHPAALQALV